VKTKFTGYSLIEIAAMHVDRLNCGIFEMHVFAESYTGATRNECGQLP